MYLQCKIDFIIRKIKNEFIFTEPNSKGNNLSRAKLKINVLFLLLWLSRVLYLTLKKAISFLNKNICLDGLCILFELKHTQKTDAINFGSERPNECEEIITFHHTPRRSLSLSHVKMLFAYSWTVSNALCDLPRVDIAALQQIKPPIQNPE
jgi:hypothetical protein